MKLLINGKPVDPPEDCLTMTDLISLPEWSGRLMIIELNGEIISKEDYGHTRLTEGDRIEFVHFVGGG